MSYQTRAYDKANDDGFAAEPVVVLVATGSHDVSRLVQLLTGGSPNTEQLGVGQMVVRQLNRHNRGRAALALLAQHGGADFREDVEEWAVEHPEVITTAHASRNAALFTLSKLPGGVLVHRLNGGPWVPDNEPIVPSEPEVTR